jgi:hypothetical protein
MVPVNSARRRWIAGALLVGVGWLASPSAVPVYDGISAPDEPYRYVSPPPGATKTAPATSVSVNTPVAGGSNSQGLSLQTGETGPQMSVFLPQFAMRAATGPIHIAVTPAAPTDLPPGATADGNVYVIAMTAPGGPVTLDKKYAAIATLYLRATSQRAPQPTMYYRPAAGAAWTALGTTAGGLDIRVSSFPGAGQYVLAKAGTAAAANAGSGMPVLPIVLVGVLVVLAAAVVVVRLRSAAGDAAGTAAPSPAE